MIRLRDKVYADLKAELDSAGIREIAYEDLKNGDKTYIQGYYKEKIRPLLSPQIIDRCHPFPHLKNKNLYAAALLKDRDNDRTLLGIVGMPESVPPILFLPGRNTEFVRTEDVLLSHLRKIFRIYKIDSSVWNCRVKPWTGTDAAGNAQTVIKSVLYLHLSAEDRLRISSQ